MNFRAISKFGFLLVIIGFFMPIACDLNGFQLASNVELEKAILLYGLFIVACIGFIIGVLLLMKKSIPPVIDWIIIVVVIGIGIVLMSQNELELQSGAYVIMVGCIVSLIAQIISTIKREK